MIYLFTLKYTALSGDYFYHNGNIINHVDSDYFIFTLEEGFSDYKLKFPKPRIEKYIYINLINIRHSYYECLDEMLKSRVDEIIFEKLLV